MMLVRFAWRNLWRHPRRTLLTLVAVAICATVLLFFMGIQFSAYAAMTNAVTHTFSGHMQIQRDGYLEKPRMRSSFRPSPDLIRKAQALSGIAGASARGTAFALVSSKSQSFGVQVVGVVPEWEGSVSTVPGLVKEGRYLEEGDSYDAVVGRLLAENLRVHVGDELTILGQGRDGSVAAGVLRIRGIFESGSQDFDRASIEMPLIAFQDLFSMDSEVHAVVLRLRNVDTLEQDKEQILALTATELQGKNVTVLTWDQLLPGMKQAIRLDIAGGWLFFSSLIVIVVFSLVNTLLMSVLERTREFGIMLSVGMRHGQIVRFVLLESIVLVCCGLLLGILCGSALLTYFGSVGFSIPGAEAIRQQMHVPTLLYPRITWPVICIGPSVILFVSLLGSLLPVSRIYFLRPVEALRSV